MEAIRQITKSAGNVDFPRSIHLPLTFVHVLDKESEIMLPNSDSIKLRHYPSAPKQGNVHPPPIFFDGVMFGITASNSHNIEVYFAFVNGNRIEFDNIL